MMTIKCEDCAGKNEEYLVKNVVCQGYLILECLKCGQLEVRKAK